MGTGSALKVASLKACKHVSKMAEDRQARSTWLGQDEMKKQEDILIVIFSFSMHLPSEIAIFEPTVCPPMVQDSPEIDTDCPENPKMVSKRTDVAKLWELLIQGGPQDGP